MCHLQEETENELNTVSIVHPQSQEKVDHYFTRSHLKNNIAIFLSALRTFKTVLD